MLSRFSGAGFCQPPTGLIGERHSTTTADQTAAAVTPSPGTLWLMNSVLFAFRKAVACVHALCLWLSRLAVLPSLRPHCPLSNATALPLWLLHQAIRADGLRHLLVPWAFIFADRTRHVTLHVFLAWYDSPMPMKCRSALMQCLPHPQHACTDANLCCPF